MTDSATLESICANDPTIRDCAARISGGRAPTVIQVDSDVSGLARGVAHSILQPDFHRLTMTPAQMQADRHRIAQNALELAQSHYPSGLIYPINKDSGLYPANAPEDRRLVLSFGVREAGGSAQHYVAGYWTSSRGDSIDFPQNDLSPAFLHVNGSQTLSAAERSQIIQQDSASINTWLAQYVHAQEAKPSFQHRSGQTR